MRTIAIISFCCVMCYYGGSCFVKVFGHKNVHLLKSCWHECNLYKSDFYKGYCGGDKDFLRYYVLL